jgi:hypothetical protein
VDKLRAAEGATRACYDEAHDICSKVEFKLRKGKGTKPLLAPGRRRLMKKDLHNLTGDEVFRYVVRTYVKKQGR